MITTSTRWSVSGFPQTAVIDLGDVYSLGRIEVVSYEGRAYQYTVSVSDTEDGTFTELVDRSKKVAQGTTANPTVDIFSATEGRYIKLTVTSADNYDGLWVSLTEFRAYEALSTSIDNDFFEESQVSLWPNPVSDILQIDAAEDFQAFEVFNQMGKLVRQESINRKSIDISNLNPGIYLIRFSNHSSGLSR